MTGARYIIIASAFIAFTGCVATIIFIGNAAVVNTLVAEGKKDLSSLDSRYNELYGHYLAFVFDRLGQEAEAEGFVALSGARYIASRAVVGLVSSGLPE